MLFGFDVGDQVCGEVGDGCMLELVDIVEQFIGFFQFKLLCGYCVLLIVGLIFELIDLVCGIMNWFSGKMGFVLVWVVVQVGVEVMFVVGLCYQDIFVGVLCIDV